jgi:hypothetical protein
MFNALGLVVALYTLWCAVDGKVYARAGNWQGGRNIVKAEEPRYYL